MSSGMSQDEEIPIYGLDRELKEKRDSQYDLEKEAQVIEFIEKLTGEHINGSFQEWLRDGVVLCKTMNGIMRDSPIKFNTSKLPFKQMENINFFLKKCEDLGGILYTYFNGSSSTRQIPYR
jgi:hypothetical protein